MSVSQITWQLPRPGKALLTLMLALGFIWLLLAIGINWLDVGMSVQDSLIGDTSSVFRGQLWRLVTAAMVHSPKAWTHIAIVLMVLYFFATPLEERWGGERLMLFLFGSSVFAYLCEVVVGTLIPALQPISQWYGAMTMAEAAAVAWALGAPRGQVVRLFFFIPVSPMTMVGLILVMSVLSVVVLSSSPEGLISPFGGMLAGWLFTERSPLRRLYLKIKLRRLQAEIESMRRPRRGKSAAHLRLIPGGGDDDDHLN